jgi:hypothetical protein
MVTITSRHVEHGTSRIGYMNSVSFLPRCEQPDCIVPSGEETCGMQTTHDSYTFVCVCSMVRYSDSINFASWLRNYATRRKVAVSSPDEVIGFFNWRNSSSRTMTLGSTQPLTEMSTRNLPGGKGWQSHRHLWASCLTNVGASTSHGLLTRIALPLPFTFSFM